MIISFTHKNTKLSFNPDTLAREITLGFMRDVCSQRSSFPLAEIKNQEENISATIASLLQQSTEKFNQIPDRNTGISPYSLPSETEDMYSNLKSSKQSGLPEWTIALNGYILGGLFYVFTSDFDPKFKINNAEDLKEQFKSIRQSQHPEIYDSIHNAYEGKTLDPALIDTNMYDYKFLWGHITKELLVPVQLIWKGNAQQLEHLHQIINSTFTLPDSELKKLQQWFTLDPNKKEPVEIVRFESDTEIYLLIQLFGQIGWPNIHAEHSYSLIHPVSGNFKSCYKWLSRALTINDKTLTEKSINRFNEKDYIERKDRQEGIKKLSESLKKIATTK